MPARKRNKTKVAWPAGLGDTAFTLNREEPMHRWVPWVAGFSAAFVRQVLEQPGLRPEHGLVLDPFAGVSTTLVEALCLGFDAWGSR